MGLLLAGVFNTASAQVETGPYAVGVAVLQQRDDSRQYHPDENPWEPGLEIDGARPIQTLVWYPAQDGSGADPALFEDYAYLTGSDETFIAPAHRVRGLVRDYVAEYVGVDASIVAEHLSAEMIALWDAPRAGGRFPLIVYAPGWSQPSWMNYELGEMLASHGYVVASSPSFSDESRNMVDGLAGLDAQARDIEFLVRTMGERPDVRDDLVGIVGYSWGGTANIIAAQRLEGIDAVVSIDGFINIGYTEVLGWTEDIATETMDIPFMSLTPPPARTNAEIIERGNDTTFVFYDTMDQADAYDLMFTRMRDHEDVVSVYTRFLDDKTDRSAADREAAERSYGFMTQYVLRFLNAYVRDDAKSLEWIQRSPEQNGLPGGYLDMRWRPKAN